MFNFLCWLFVTKQHPCQTVQLKTQDHISLLWNQLMWVNKYMCKEVEFAGMRNYSVKCLKPSGRFKIAIYTMGKSSKCRIVAGEQQLSECGSHCRFKAFRGLLGKQYELAHGMWFTINFPLGMSVLLISSRQENMKINHKKNHTCKHSFSIESLSSIYGSRWCALECNSFWEDWKLDDFPFAVGVTVCTSCGSVGLDQSGACIPFSGGGCLRERVLQLQQLTKLGTQVCSRNRFSDWPQVVQNRSLINHEQLCGISLYTTLIRLA